MALSILVYSLFTGLIYFATGPWHLAAVRYGAALGMRGEWSLCDNTNPNAWMPEKLYGQSGGGFFGYSHAFGG